MAAKPCLALAESIVSCPSANVAKGVQLLCCCCPCSVLESDPSQPSLVGLAALAALWRGILPSARSRVQLLALDGMDVLLTQLQRGNIYLRSALAPLVFMLCAYKESCTCHATLYSCTATVGAVGQARWHGWAVISQQNNTQQQLCRRAVLGLRQQHGCHGGEGQLLQAVQ